MRATNQLVNRGNDNPKTFSAFINGDAVRKGIIERMGGDPQLAARFIATVNTAVMNNPKLQECDYGSIVSAALHGEVGMNLSLALGQYAIVPYGKTATYQLQVNGLQQLCIRSKAYTKVKVYDVREGEFVGRDPMTRDPIFKWIEDEDERLELPIVGYYAFYQLGSDFNNFFNCLYWSHEKILRHADRYSAGFSLDTYKKLLAGELAQEEVEKLQGTKKKKGSSPWYANPNDDPHIKMCKKTVLKQLLNDGLAPKSIQDVLIEDNYVESHDEGILHEDGAFFVNASTGEVVEAEAVEVSDTQEGDNAPTEPQKEKPQKNTSEAKRSEEVLKNGATDANDVQDFTEGFFGD